MCVSIHIFHRFLFFTGGEKKSFFFVCAVRFDNNMFTRLLQCTGVLVVLIAVILGLFLSRAFVGMGIDNFERTEHKYPSAFGLTPLLYTGEFGFNFEDIPVCPIHSCIYNTSYKRKHTQNKTGSHWKDGRRDRSERRIRFLHSSTPCKKRCRRYFGVS
jgi:hypothetical protein